MEGNSSTLFTIKLIEPQNLQIHAIARLTAFLPELGITKFDENLPLDLDFNSKLKIQYPQGVLFCSLKVGEAKSLAPFSRNWQLS